MDQLRDIETAATSRAQQAQSLQQLAELRAEYLGKKGLVGQALRSMGSLPAAERPVMGQKVNAVKETIEGAFQQARGRLESAKRDAALEAGRIDVTLPGRRVPRGRAHPLRQVQEDIIHCLSHLGFSVAEGRLVEHDWYNFEALNIPQHHPARDMQDTFFLADDVVLRTHTSNAQIRIMQQKEPPVRILAPGMVFRHDDVDATHSPVFHQIEGLWIDEQATFGDLKGVLCRLIAHLFGPQARLRFRPSYFPFTEPSVEVDMSCLICGGGDRTAPDCRVCRGAGWIEILGAGMVDPAVLEAVGYDPDAVQGFAFGVGLERIAMLRWGVDDIRLFYENDARFLHQF